ncbi:hypothetical protein NL676_024599 [Syzygium grande]|nr:hypothetical protein NL676_024599 [Syzygium grande]
MDSSCSSSIFKRVMSLVAALALFTLFVTPLPADASPAEAQTLLKWKSSLGNPSVSSLSSWTPSPRNATGYNSTMSPCAWYGISCNQAGSVIMINLTSANVKGTLDEFPFSSLSRLMYMDLSVNHLSGHIPHQIGLLSNLTYLDLSENLFSGKIPTNWGSCTRLVALRIAGNNITGNLPPEIGNATQLQRLDLSSNGLVGEIPKELGKLKLLLELSLNNNSLTGPIPFSLADLTHLQVLLLNDNQLSGRFTGPLPANLIAKLQGMMNGQNGQESQNKSLYMQGVGTSFYEDSVKVTMKGQEIRLVRILTTLATIDLSLNSFQGNIPSVIGNLHSLIGLNLSHNHLMGPIPSTLRNLTNLEWLDLSSNKLSGRVPMELGDLSFLGYLDLSENQLTGPIPQDKQLSTFTSNSFRGNLGLCGTPLQNKCPGDAQPPPPPQLFFQKYSTREHGSGFDRKAIGIGYASGIVIGISLAEIDKGRESFKRVVTKTDASTTTRRPGRDAEKNRKQALRGFSDTNPLYRVATIVPCYVTAALIKFSGDIHKSGDICSPSTVHGEVSSRRHSQEARSLKNSQGEYARLHILMYFEFLAEFFHSGRSPIKVETPHHQSSAKWRETRLPAPNHRRKLAKAKPHRRFAAVSRPMIHNPSDSNLKRPPDITDAYSLLILNISFPNSVPPRLLTSQLLFVSVRSLIDASPPRADRRTGESRGFAFVRYKYADEAQKAVDKLDGRVVDGREIGVQFAKYGPNAERIDRGKIAEPVSKIRRRSRSRSPCPRYRDESRDRDYRRSRSRSRG